MTKTDFTWPKMTPRGAKHVVLCAGHLYKQFWTKKIDRVDRRGQGRSKYGPEWASLINPMQNSWLWSSLSTGPLMGQGPLKWSPLTDLHPFPGSLTHLRNSSGLPSQKFCIEFINQAHSGPYFVFFVFLSFCHWGPLEVIGGQWRSTQINPR